MASRVRLDKLLVEKALLPTREKALRSILAGDVLVDGLNKLGWNVPKPKGTMFVWAPIPESFRGLGSLDRRRLAVVREVILRLFRSLIETAPTLGAGLDWKSSLQELTASRGMGAPVYTVTSTGPDHDKEFTATVLVTDVEYGKGIGRTKKEAELKAAAAAWTALAAPGVDA